MTRLDTFFDKFRTCSKKKEVPKLSFSKKFRGPLGYVLAPSLVPERWSKNKTDKVLLRSSIIIFEAVCANQKIHSSVLESIYEYSNLPYILQILPKGPLKGPITTFYTGGLQEWVERVHTNVISKNQIAQQKKKQHLSLAAF